MTAAERKEFSDFYQSRIKLFERKYTKLFNTLLQKQIEKFIHVMETRGIHYARHEINHLIFDADLTHLLTDLYKDVGTYFAKTTTQQIKRQFHKSGGLGTNETWVNRILNYFRTHLLNNAVIPINATTRQRVLSELERGENLGLGVEEIARQMRSDELTMNHALLIARTESGKAANVGRQLAVEDIKFVLDKEWISAEDSRVRPAHAEQDGNIIPEDEMFNVDGELMNAPCDPTASPENICNCRCVVSFLPKRDSGGRLIPKS